MFMIILTKEGKRFCLNFLSMRSKQIFSYFWIWIYYASCILGFCVSTLSKVMMIPQGHSLKDVT